MHKRSMGAYAVLSAQQTGEMCCCCCCYKVASVVSDSVRSRRWQPTRLPIPGILQARTLKWVAIAFSNTWKWSRSLMSDSSWPHGLQPTRLLRPWDFPGKSTGVGCHCLLRLMRQRFWSSHSPLGFWAPQIGILHLIKSPCPLKFSIKEMSPCFRLLKALLSSALDCFRVWV